MGKAAFVFCAALTLGACGTPGASGVAERREALSLQPLPLRVVFVVDASGSMIQPLDDSPSSPPRWEVATQLVTDLTAALPAGAESALAVYPFNASCGAPPALELPFSRGSDMAFLAERLPRGGTPTAATLRFVESLPELHDASFDRLVVLVTDGVPNCNDAHPGNACAAQPTCTCTLAACGGANCSLGCADDDATTAAALALGAAGVQILTVTVGPDWENSDEAAALSAALGQVAVRGGCGPNCRSRVLPMARESQVPDAKAELAERLRGCGFVAGGEVGRVEVGGAQVGFVSSGERLWLEGEACRLYRAGASVKAFR